MVTPIRTVLTPATGVKIKVKRSSPKSVTVKRSTAIPSVKLGFKGQIKLTHAHKFLSYQLQFTRLSLEKTLGNFQVTFKVIFSMNKVRQSNSEYLRSFKLKLDTHKATPIALSLQQLLKIKLLVHSE